jgi:hypothetical protein
MDKYTSREAFIHHVLANPCGYPNHIVLNWVQVLQEEQKKNAFLYPW